MKLVILAAVAGLAVSANADIVTQWNFNSPIPDAATGTGTTAPSTGSGTLSLLGGITSSFSSGDANGGSSDPASGDDSGLQTTGYGAQGAGSGTRGVAFAVSTVGFQNITISVDNRHSNTSSKYVQIQYSLDGLNFTSAGLSGNGIFSASTGGDTWYNGRSVDLSAIAGASNNANFAFRVVTVFAPGTNAYEASTSGASYAGTGTLRFDMVTVNGVVPAPGAMALLGLGALAAGRRRR
jgi:MYXO-CTERM domain-containing protein